MKFMFRANIKSKSDESELSFTLIDFEFYATDIVDL